MLQSKKRLAVNGPRVGTRKPSCIAARRADLDLMVKVNRRTAGGARLWTSFAVNKCHVRSLDSPTGLFPENVVDVLENLLEHRRNLISERHDRILL